MTYKKKKITNKGQKRFKKEKKMDKNDKSVKKEWRKKYIKDCKKGKKNG